MSNGYEFKKKQQPYASCRSPRGARYATSGTQLMHDGEEIPSFAFYRDNVSRKRFPEGDFLLLNG